MANLRAIAFGLGLILAACEDDVVGTVDPFLELEPVHLDFGTLELGQEAVLELTVRNLEKADGRIESLAIVDDCNGCFLALSIPTDVLGLTKVDVPIRFRATSVMTATGTVTFTTDDPRAPNLVATLVGRGDDSRAPDLEVFPAAVDFGFVPAGGIAVGSFAIRSTGTNDLLVDRISIEPLDAPFRITTSTPTPENPGRLAPGAQVSVSLRAELPLTATGTETGRILISTNVALEKNVPGSPGVVAVPLSARANLPPVAVTGPDQTVEPYSIVTLDGANSYDPDVPADLPLTYRWAMDQKPAGSTATLEFARTPTPEFLADLAGRYELSLVVVDATGLESQPARTVVEAFPDEAVRIELIWDHPYSDLDLHLIREGGAFCTCPDDLHYRECLPDQPRQTNWFPEAPGANPRLDVDDREGFGPENINIDGDGVSRFVPASRFTIAVHLYDPSDHGDSPWPTTTSNAIVRVFVFGLLAAEYTHALSRRDDVWTVATFDWPSRTFTEIGSLDSARCAAF
ncbi:MAG: choice-of-anchor D domain-containing protein [Deltaproteobacteria bacterium]|nr:choice-of-anchor D domain-containing protein [Deltaproteobacteria bacterium]